ncbi:unnamed protein product [Adineta ricciae]|uniref:Uncharacterized protein n=1 Tax=Adineta ricciae TaxID=249248 RepID=A0A815SJW3_ADIRI|nr:unnamed protein product [Adineta ricciae]CAF1603506.1 unnamed protein product [Adineta ricciae]
MAFKDGTDANDTITLAHAILTDHTVPSVGYFFGNLTNNILQLLIQELCVNNDDRSSPPRPVSPLHQPTTVRPDKFVLNQPVTIQLIDKNTQKLVNGTIRSLAFQRK